MDEARAERGARAIRPADAARFHPTGGTIQELRRQVPNLLSGSRAGMAALFPWLPVRARGPVLIGALASEFLDGYTARRYGWESQLGQLLDPVADKLFFASTTLTFIRERRVGWGELLASGVRDLFVVTASVRLMAQGRWSEFRRMKPRILGKATTALQYVVLFELARGRRPDRWLVTLTCLAGTGASLQYARAFRRTRGPTEPRAAEGLRRELVQAPERKAG